MKKLKLIILGNKKVGKTKILNQLIGATFEIESQMITSPDKVIKKVKIKNNELLLLEIWDIPGSEFFLSSNKFFIKKSNIILLVYDITNRSSFDDLIIRLNQIKKINNEKETIYGVIGNKNDLYMNRVIEEEEGKNIANNNNALFFEISANDNIIIENIFIKLSEEYFERKVKNEKREEENAIKEGKTIINYDNGDKYIGYINNNKRDGKGKMIFNNGNIYDGDWLYDVFIKGIISYKNGEEYEGYINNNKREGKGKMKYNNGDIYDGNWINDFFINGIIKYKNGEEYEGYINNNKREIKGEMKYNNGDIYKGNWKNNLKEGKGEMKYNNGDIYEGDWKNDLKEGKGKMKYNNGDIYEGDWKNDLKEGQGKFINKKGYYEYEGEWNNNYFNGYVEKYYNKNKKLFQEYSINKNRKVLIINENNQKLELKFNNSIIEGEGIFSFINEKILIGTFNNNCNKTLMKGILFFKNEDIYEGDFDTNGNRLGKGIMKNINGEIFYGEFYNKNEGLFCLNEEDYNILKNINIKEKNLIELFNLNLNDLFYVGNYKDNKKEGEGILYMNKNNEFQNIIYKGNFKKDKKDGFGKIYFETGNIFESYWESDKIDKKESCIFYLNNEIQYKNNNFNVNEWIIFKNFEMFKIFGNNNKKIINKTIIR